MKKFFRAFTLLLAGVFVFASCLNSDDDTDYSSYGDTAITSFVVSTMPAYVHTTTSTGADSVYKTTMSCSAYKFYIDQTTCEIYNPDSLPSSADASKTICVISAKNGGSVMLKSLTSDSLTYYSSTDSIDFSQPREVRVYNLAGTSYRAYTVKVNVHQQKGDTVTWNASAVNSSLASLTGMKALSLGGKIWVFGQSGSQTKVYTTPESSVSSWSEVSSSVTLSADAYKSAVVKDDKFYILSDGTVYSSSDAATWTSVGTASLQQLLGAADAGLFALSESGALMLSEDDGASWTEESLDDDAALLPTQDISFIRTALSTNEGAERVMIVGNRSEIDYAADSTAQVWSRVIEADDDAQVQPWSYLVMEPKNPYKAPRLAALNAVWYSSGILALGGKGLGASTAEAFSQFYWSGDGGITWVCDSVFTLPDGFSSSDTSFAMVVDSSNYLWLICGGTGQVWKGVRNEFAWTDEEKSYTE